MGQSQSSNRPQDDAPAEERDLYKLLDVEYTATADEIKKAYRRKALELHPDKNYGNIDEATELFAQVQSAYEVLADPQERAWYDSHRESILFNGTRTGGAGQSAQGSNVTTTEDVMGYFAKYGSRVQFSDSPTGFFGGLRDLFDQLAREEALASKLDGLDPLHYPSFGSKDDDHSTVREFYSVWSGFATRKSFAWKEAYRYSEAPDRRVRRLMEKENRRLREEGMRDFNDALRSLVAFAKKRDPRYKATQQSEAERQKVLRDAAAAQAARSRAANEAKMQDFSLPHWAMSENHGVDEYITESESESEPDQFICELCRKNFKSEKQFEAHERSKKHLKAVKQVQREMRDEDEEFQLNPAQDEQQSADPSPPPSDTDEPEIPPESPVIDPKDSSAPPSEEDPNHPDENVDPAPTTQNGPATGEDADSDASSATSNGTPAVDKKDEGQDIEGLRGQVSEAALTDTAPPPKVGKAKQKRAKKAAQKEEKTEFACVACHAVFPSKTKLFNHIKELDHAQPMTRPQVQNKKPNKKKKRP